MAAHASHHQDLERVQQPFDALEAGGELAAPHAEAATFSQVSSSVALPIPTRNDAGSSDLVIVREVAPALASSPPLIPPASEEWHEVVGKKKKKKLPSSKKAASGSVAGTTRGGQQLNLKTASTKPVKPPVLPPVRISKGLLKAPVKVHDNTANTLDRSSRSGHSIGSDEIASSSIHAISEDDDLLSISSSPRGTMSCAKPDSIQDQLDRLIPEPPASVLAKATSTGHKASMKR